MKILTFLKNSRFILGLILLQISFGLQALDVSCGEIERDEFESGFEDIRDLAIATNYKLCQSQLTFGDDHENQYRITLFDFSSAVRTMVYESFDRDSFSEAVDTQFDYFDQTIAGLAGDFDDDGLERLNSDGLFETQLYFDGRVDSKSEISADLDSACKKVAGSKKRFSGCEAAFKDVASAFNAYRDGYNNYRYGKNEKQLSALSAQWEKFLTEARGQTFLDVRLTTWMHRNYYSQTKLVAPAATQYFLLRPQIVYEHTSGVPKGDKDNIALSIEWIGINWWNTKFPIGISIVSVYLDKPNQDSVATGVQLTFDNEYSIGVTKRGDETAIFLTLDLIKLFQDNSKKLETYKSQF
jgi:hypothetical protein